MTNNNPTTPPTEAEALCKRLKADTRLDPACPFSTHCYCNEAVHETIADPDKFAAATLIRQQQAEIERLREVLKETLRQIEKYGEYFCEEDFDPTVDLVRAALSQGEVA